MLVQGAPVQGATAAPARKAAAAVVIATKVTARPASIAVRGVTPRNARTTPRLVLSMNYCW